MKYSLLAVVARFFLFSAQSCHHSLLRRRRPIPGGQCSGLDSGGQKTFGTPALTPQTESHISEEYAEYTSRVPDSKDK